MSLRIKKFYADWCLPCKAITPALNQAASELGLEVEEIDIETNRDAAIDYNVRSIPTLVVVNGKENGRITGAHTYEQLKEKLEDIINDSVS